MKKIKKIKVLITGASGLLGSVLTNVLEKYDLYAFTKEQFDVTNFNNSKLKLQKINPDVIIHTAALTDLDYCELNPQISNVVNVLSTQNLVEYCYKTNCKMIYISSTGVYGNKYLNKNYKENDYIQPTTIHHKHKYESEILIKNKLKNFLVLRTGWLYGGSIHHKKNFVIKRYFEAKNKKIIYSDNSQYGNPTYALNFAKQIKLLLEKNISGTFNCVDHAKNVTRHYYVQEIIKNFDLNCQVKIGKKEIFKRAAPVSCNESALNNNLNKINLDIMKEWKLSLKGYIENIKKQMK